MRRRLLALVLAVAAIAQLAVALPRPGLHAGDGIQIALPLVAAACSAARGDLGETVGRFAALMAVAHGLKAALGDQPMNTRPNGDGSGFPSAHTAAAVFGASAVLRTCGAAVPYVGPAVTVAAAYVAGTRIEGRRHTLNQTLAGAVFALVADRSFRTRAARARVAQIWWQLVDHGEQALRRVSVLLYVWRRQRRRQMALVQAE